MKRNELIYHKHRIAYLSGDGNYTLVHFVDSPHQMFAATLYLCLEELPGFIRIHRKYAVNPAFVSAAEGNNLTAVVTVNGEQLPISRRLAKSVFLALNHPELIRPQQPRLPRPLYYHMTTELWQQPVDLTWR